MKKLFYFLCLSFLQIFFNVFCLCTSILGDGNCVVSCSIYNKSQFFKISIVVLLASTLHTSAVIFFPTYFICKYQYSRNILVWGIVVSILLGLTSVIKYLFSFVGGESGLEKVIAYGTSEAGVS